MNAGGAAFKRVPEAKPFADFLELRSVGIQDLRFGYLRDEDWTDRDPHERAAQLLGTTRARSRRRRTTSSRAGLRDPNAIHSRALIGDVLVRKASAASPLDGDGKPHGDSKHVQGASHFHLLNHPQTYEHIRDWLSQPLLEAAAAGTRSYPLARERRTSAARRRHRRPLLDDCAGNADLRLRRRRGRQGGQRLRQRPRAHPGRLRLRGRPGRDEVRRCARGPAHVRAGRGAQHRLRRRRKARAAPRNSKLGGLFGR